MVVSFGIGSLIETPVIPAKAGIQSVVGAFPMACGVDSRFRGNDWTREGPCLAIDTTTVPVGRWFSPALEYVLSGGALSVDLNSETQTGWRFDEDVDAIS